jgi:hypothetical protein
MSKDSEKYYALQAIRKMDSNHLYMVADWVKRHRGAGDKELISLILTFGTPSQSPEQIEALHKAMDTLNNKL